MFLDSYLSLNLCFVKIQEPKEWRKTQKKKKIVAEI